MIYGGDTGTYSWENGMNPMVDKIYKYNTDGGQWDEVTTTMSQAKYGVAAIKIKGSIFNSC